MVQRILKISCVILLFAILGGAAGVYLLHHNRNYIVSYLTEQLRQHSNVEINITNTSVGFRQGITFDMLDVHARSASGHFDLKTPRIHIRLELLPLLQGEIVSTRAELREPEIIWHITAATHAHNTPDASLAIPLEQRWEIRTDTLAFILSTWRDIICSDASITIHPGEHDPLQFSHANLSLSQAGIETTLLAELTGDMHTSAQQKPMRINMKTGLSAPSSEHTLLFSQISTETFIHLRSVDVAEANKYLRATESQIELQGKVELKASLAGSLAQGLNIGGSIRSNPLSGDKEHLRINYLGTAIELSDTEFSGILTYVPEGGVEFSAIKFKNAFTKLQGDVRLTPEEQHADITFSTAPVTYVQLSPLLADLPPVWGERLHKGQIICKALHYSGPLTPPVPSGIQSSRWVIELPALIPAEYTPSASKLPRITLKHTGAIVEVRSSPLEWNGETFRAKAALDMHGEWDAEDKSFSAKVNLAQTEAAVGTVGIKTYASPAQLRFKLHPRPQGWKIANASLQSAEIDLHCSAQSDAASGFNANFKLTKFDLDALRTRVPILDVMQLGGKVDLDYSLQRQKTHWIGNGTLTLHDGSIAPTDILGHIHHVNGTATINGYRLEAPRLSLKLGEDSSPMRASAYIADLRQPVADIHASGDGVVANDLIFDSRTALLHNLEGHLRIHAKGIDFVSARVDLEQGTHAEVQGVLGFSTPDMDLDIHATYADIDEVIALWHAADEADREDPAEQTFKHEIPPTLPANETLFIDARVDNGVFSGFAFQNARGRINIQQEQLRIGPLEFNADAGKGSGEIIITTKVPAYLKISGTLENIDADKVYTQIFKDLGLITGPLNGSFSLHGPIGSQFSANTAGTFRVDVRDGVIRQFKFLSKAFSLLNVAQLFKMQLPDMASEGMPFKRISADLNMEDGVLHSNNMLIRSEAMNLAFAGDFSLPRMQIDAAMALNPLGTVDSIFSKIPVAGWLLTGDKKTFITVEFDVSGPAQEPVVSMKPLSSVSNQMFGILKRALSLPGTTFTDPGKVFFHQSKDQDKPEGGKLD
ncbi:MAG: AsmA-like C-terminal domain-containing protein [Desulfuromonadaceae bacterium]|nr:AsmA-like C-terminal domain-containing protein [Desulfuromonadaceae bacterium]